MKRFAGKPILAKVHRFASAREKREWQLAENLHRRNLTALQRADAYSELYEFYKEELGGVRNKHIFSTMAKGLEEIFCQSYARRTKKEGVCGGYRQDGQKRNLLALKFR